MVTASSDPSVGDGIDGRENGRLFRLAADENRRLKKPVADLSLDKQMLQDVLSRMG